MADRRRQQAPWRRKLAGHAVAFSLAGLLGACATLSQQPLPTPSEALVNDPPPIVQAPGHRAIAAGQVQLDT